MSLPDPDFWRGRRVLLTGHTGFKGSWLGMWLEDMGAEVAGLSLPPEGPVSLYASLSHPSRSSDDIVDIRDAAAVHKRVAAVRPDVVFHLAAQALVRRGYADPVGTFAVNVTGTVNLMEAIKQTGTARAVVVATTDKVYRNTGEGRVFVETDPLGGSDPYSESKVACEMVVAGYRAHFESAGCGLVTARAGNVIGGGDWAEDRLLPDAVRAWSQGEPLEVRRPDATRPWQHVLEPLRGYILLAERLARGDRLAPAYNFGPDGAASVRDVLADAAAHFNGARTNFAAQPAGPHEAATLALDPSLARRDLGVAPVWSLRETVARTARWYSAFLSEGHASELCRLDRAEFLSAVREEASGVAA